jgi:hypothetical protein
LVHLDEAENLFLQKVKFSEKKVCIVYCLHPNQVITTHQTRDDDGGKWQHDIDR